MNNKYTVKSKKEANTLKAALCTKYPDAATTINDVFLSSDDGWVDVVVETENNLILNGWQSGAPAEWTINFNGDIVGYYNAECDIDDDFVESEDDIMGKVNNTTNETVNNTTKGGIDMGKVNEVNEEVAATVEEVTMGEKAKAFAEASKEKLTDGFKYVVENVEVAKEEVEKMANMKDSELEEYLKTNSKSVLNKIIDAVKSFAGKRRKTAEEFSFFADTENEAADKAEGIVVLIKQVLDEEELNGWGKFKQIVKELIKWVLRLLLKVGAIVLKLALTIAVGAIKIGATGLVTAGKALGVLNKEVIKPGVSASKNAWANHKARKAEKVKEQEEDFDEFEGGIFN